MDFCQLDNPLFNFIIPRIPTTNSNEVFVFFGSGTENAGKDINIMFFYFMIYFQSINSIV